MKWSPQLIALIGLVLLGSVVGILTLVPDNTGTPPGAQYEPLATITGEPATDYCQTVPASHSDDCTRPVVSIFDGDTGVKRGSVAVAIADTPALRYTGLSEAEMVPTGEGMLFVYEAPAERTFVMREMAVGLDIVFVDETGTITAIHTADPPGPAEDGSTMEYTGHGQYVLEVPQSWTTTNGITPGDRLRLEADSLNSDP